jgi:glycosyltransferase involved in cell wall biosynthesis
MAYPSVICFIWARLSPANIPRLLDAYAQIAHEVDAPLLIGGGKGWLYEPILAQAERLNLGDKLRFVGYIPQAEQHLWYGAAMAFVFPSLYEGFGMPPLEAMACGTPVIVSNASCLPEVTGDAGYQVDPHDVDAWALAMRQVLNDAALREDLAARGLYKPRVFRGKKLLVAPKQSIVRLRAASRIMKGFHNEFWYT